VRGRRLVTASYSIWGFLRLQLLFSGFFSAYGLVLGAVLGIFAVSATFSRDFFGLWAEFESCFGDFCGFSYFSRIFSGLWAEFWELF